MAIGEYKEMAEKKENKRKTDITLENLSRQVRKKLEPGMIIKNYKELCSLLCLSEMGGNTKKANLKNLEQFCKYEKSGNKFKILEIYEEALERQDKRIDAKKSIYCKYFETLMLGYFIAHEDKEEYTPTKKQLWNDLGMIGKSYIENSGSEIFLQDFISEHKKDGLKIYPWQFERANHNVYSLLDDITKKGLASLANRKLITYKPEIIWKCKNGQKGERVYTLREENKIDECRKSALFEMNCGGMNELFGNPTKMKKFIRLRNQFLKTELGIDYIYTTYSITPVRKYLQQGLEESVKEARKLLNVAALEKLEKKAIKEYMKNMEELATGKTEFNFGEHFVEIQKLFFEKLLKLSDEEIEKYTPRSERSIQTTNEEVERAIDQEIPGV